MIGFVSIDAVPSTPRECEDSAKETGAQIVRGVRSRHPQPAFDRAAFDAARAEFGGEPFSDATPPVAVYPAPEAAPPPAYAAPAQPPNPVIPAGAVVVVEFGDWEAYVEGVFLAAREIDAEALRPGAGRDADLLKRLVAEGYLTKSPAWRLHIGSDLLSALNKAAPRVESYV